MDYTERIQSINNELYISYSRLWAAVKYDCVGTGVYDVPVQVYRAPGCRCSYNCQITVSGACDFISLVNQRFSTRFIQNHAVDSSQANGGRSTAQIVLQSEMIVTTPQFDVHSCTQ